MDAPTYDPDQPPTDWAELGWYFDGILIWSIHPPCESSDVYNFVNQSDLNSEQLLDRLEKVDSEHSLQVLPAIHMISSSGEIDLRGFAPEAIAAIKLRAETIASFLHMLEIEVPGLFPAPTSPMREMIRWLMVDWWNLHGRQLCVDYHLADRKSNS